MNEVFLKIKLPLMIKKAIDKADKKIFIIHGELETGST